MCTSSERPRGVPARTRGSWAASAPTCDRHEDRCSPQSGLVASAGRSHVGIGQLRPGSRRLLPGQLSAGLAPLLGGAEQWRDLFELPAVPRESPMVRARRPKQDQLSAPRERHDHSAGSVEPSRLGPRRSHQRGGRAPQGNSLPLYHRRWTDRGVRNAGRRGRLPFRCIDIGSPDPAGGCGRSSAVRQVGVSARAPNLHRRRAESLRGRSFRHRGVVRPRSGQRSARWPGSLSRRVRYPVGHANRSGIGCRSAAARSLQAGERADGHESRLESDLGHRVRDGRLVGTTGRRDLTGQRWSIGCHSDHVRRSVWSSAGSDRRHQPPLQPGRLQRNQRRISPDGRLVVPAQAVAGAGRCLATAQVSIL